MAVTVDANQQVVPLAYAVVDSESYSSWHWFLHMVAKHIIRDIEGACLISDRHAGLAKSVKLKDMCFKDGAEPRVTVFHKIMEQSKALDTDAFAYLDGIDKSKWTLSHDGGKRCGILTTNMSESINGVMKCARRIPITTIVRITFARSIHIFFDRLKDTTRLRNMQQFWPDGSVRAQVSVRVDGSVRARNFRVSLSNTECSCGRWASSGLPCSHAIKVCTEFRADPRVYVQDYYSTVAYLRTYSDSAF
ncbi:hypothetical protein PHJA_000611600 [Phtheirospermum japonicum]|uniref:SWIM-type domain-containing protein n=1 Tax=Phtheirospermum japonicum TaxID=374723 RepID=A0A830BC67_9LAMI|nr:hypothetical protein PHJA_000611600 [Phtheirospermum japonicum]